MTHFLQRTALIALATGSLGACATVEPMGPAPTAEAPAAAPAPAPAPPPPADAPVTVAPAAPVEQRPLEAPAPARPAPTPAQAQATPAPIATYRSVTTRSVTGKVVEVEGAAQTYKVRKGDTLEEVADRFGVSVPELRRMNGLKKRHNTILPGEVLKGPRRASKAYVTGQGDTLYSIARRFSVTADALRDENDIGRDAGLRPGQKLRLPAGFHDRGPLVTSARVRVDLPAPAESEAAAPSEAPPETTAPEPAAPAGPTYRTVTTRSVTGRVVEVEGPAVSYKVRKGDNLTDVADKLGVSLEELRDLNGLKKKRSTIHPGQVLKGPRRTSKAYVAGSGDTLYAVARRFSVTPEALRSENGLSRNAGLRPGQKLRLPEGYRDRGPVTATSRVMIAPAPTPAPAPRPAPAAPSRPAYTYTPPPPQPQAAPVPAAPEPEPYRRPLPPPPRSVPRTYTPAPSSGPVAAPTAAPTPADEQISSLGRGRFIWPLQGDIVSDFGPKASGQRNDGLNIAAQVGASVRAAAAGDVVYAGDQVPGFGNLVLIKHADGWVTAYGHLSRVLVKMQQKVTQGQEIGLAGATGGVAEPQLHFEVRYAPSPLERAKPIDPRLVLPR